MLGCPRLGRGPQKIGHRVVQAWQVDSNPGAQEDDVTHQGLVLKRCPETASIALLLAGVGCLQPEAPYADSKPAIWSLGNGGSRLVIRRCNLDAVTKLQGMTTKQNCLQLPRGSLPS